MSAYAEIERYSVAAAIANDVIEERYGDMHEQFATDFPLWNLFDQNSEGFNGFTFVWEAVLDRHARLAARAEEGDLPLPARVIGVPFMVRPARFFHTLRITGRQLDLIKSGNSVQFGMTLDTQMAALLRDSKKLMNDVLYRDGTGAIANVTGQAAAVLTVSTIKGFYIGQLVDVMTAAGSASTDSLSRKITAISEANVTITLDADPGTVTGGTYYVYVAGAKSGTTCYECMGLGGIVNNAAGLDTIQNLSRTTYPQLEATIRDLSSTYKTTASKIGSRDVNSFLNYLKAYKGAKTSALLMTPETYEFFTAMVGPNVHWADIPLQGGGMVKGWNFDNRNIPMIQDIACPNNTIYFLDTSEIHLKISVPWKWSDLGGSILKWESGKDAAIAYLVADLQLTCDNFSKQGKLTNVTGFVAYSQETG